MKIFKSNFFLSSSNQNAISIFFLICYLFYLTNSTGIVSDEITEINFIEFNNLSWESFFNILPEAYNKTVYFRVVEYYLFYWVYFLGDNK